jgi:hypothetical protein
MNPWDGGKGTPDKGVKSQREAYCDDDGRVKTGVKLREGGLEDAKTVITSNLLKSFVWGMTRQESVAERHENF